MQVEARQRGLKRGEEPDGQSHAAGTLQHVDAAAHTLDDAGQIEGALRLEGLPAVGSEELPREGGELRRGQGLAHHAQLALHPHPRRQPALEMQVGGAELFGLPDQAIEGHHRRSIPLLERRKRVLGTTAARQNNSTAVGAQAPRGAWDRSTTKNTSPGPPRCSLRAMGVAPALATLMLLVGGKTPEDPCQEARSETLSYELNTTVMPVPKGTDWNAKAKEASKQVPEIAVALQTPKPWNGKPAIEPLLEAIHDPDYNVSGSALTALGHLFAGDPAQGRQALVLTHVSRGILEMMRGHDHAFDPDSTIVANPSSDPDLDLILLGSGTLATIGKSTASELLKALRDPGSPVLHHIQAQALGPVRGVALIGDLKAESEAEVRRRLALAIAMAGLWRDKRVVELARDEADPAVRCLLGPPQKPAPAPKAAEQ